MKKENKIEFLEEWKDIPEYEGLYQVSNLGRVYSYPKEWIISRGGYRKMGGKLISSKKNTDGYYCINLSKEGKAKTKRIHKLVAISFLGHIPDGHNIVVDHIDGNKSNNCVDNLQLITQRENINKDKKGTSKYYGVSWHKVNCKWITKIEINGRRIHLGYFHNEEEAGEMYQVALKHIDKYDGDAKAFREFILNQRKR